MTGYFICIIPNLLDRMYKFKYLYHICTLRSNIRLKPEVSSQMTSSHYYFSRFITSQGREGDLKIESMLLSKYSLISKERRIVYLNISRQASVDDEMNSQDK